MHRRDRHGSPRRNDSFELLKTVVAIRCVSAKLITFVVNRHVFVAVRPASLQLVAHRSVSLLLSPLSVVIRRYKRTATIHNDSERIAANGDTNHNESQRITPIYYGSQRCDTMQCDGQMDFCIITIRL